mmetsp:Transcript_91424/g.153162  ORF Transcript_91424/g.153162 Transcript_91424/m.153162 type:complete len:279 (-) Transcript_91424:958-1794(-)
MFAHLVPCVGLQLGHFFGGLDCHRGLYSFFFDGPFHPTSFGGASNSRMLKTDPHFAFLSLGMALYTEHRVVPHAHEIPGQLLRLCIVLCIPCTDLEFWDLHHVTHVHFVFPKHPTPVLVMQLWSIRCLLLRPLTVAKLPCLAIVERDLNTSHTCATTRIGIPTDEVVFCIQAHKGIMPWVGNCGVDVQLVEEVLWLIPPSLSLSKLSIHVGWHNAVIKEMIVIVRGLLGHSDGGHPLDHPPTNPPWNNNPQRVPMVWCQLNAVHLPCNQHVIGPIHRQ